MALDGSGTFSRLYDWTDDRDAAVKIRADRMDDEFNGIATALSTALYKDGQQTTTALVPFALGLSVGGAAQTIGGSKSYVNAVGTGGADSSISAARFSADAAAAEFKGLKSRDTTPGDFTIVQDDDVVVQLTGYVDDGTDYATPVGQVSIEVDGTPGADDAPGRIVLKTTADGANSLTEAMRIDAAQRVVIGAVDAQTVGGIAATFQVLGTGDADSSAIVGRWSADATPPRLIFLKSRDGTIGDNTIVQNNDVVGRIIAAIDDGTDYASIAASISFGVSTTPGADDSPGYIAFNVTADGAASTTEASRINHSGTHLIGKTSADSGAAAGIQLNGSGAAFLARDSNRVLHVNRLTSDGDVISIQQDGTEEGTIDVSGTTVGYNTFTGAHYAQWGTGLEPAAEPPLGTVLSTVDEAFERWIEEIAHDVPARRDGAGNVVEPGRTVYEKVRTAKRSGARVSKVPKPELVKVRISNVVGDVRVYGVFRRINPETGDVSVASLGTHLVRVTGPCAGGDILVSNGDGTAIVDNAATPRTCVGKASRGDPRPGEKLVPAVLYCG